jgi:ribosomal protein S18 acetylase RimI-like enzyme
MQIRSMIQEDIPALSMIMADAEAEHGRGSIPSHEEIEYNLANLPLGVNFLIALDDNLRIAGFSSYSVLYPGMGWGLGYILYLKEIYVIKECRKQGIGTRLMSALAHIAQYSGCDRMGWTAPAEDKIALALWDKLGAQRAEWMVSYRIGGDALTDLAAQDHSQS